MYSVTINHKEWNPTVPHPYAIVAVDLDEQDGLRLVSNMIGIEADQVRIDMPVEVAFDQQGDVFFPVFRPLAAP